MVTVISLALLIVLMPSRLHEFLHLGLQQFVEGFLCIASQNLLELALDYGLASLYNFFYNKFGQEHRTASPVFFPSHA